LRALVEQRYTLDGRRSLVRVKRSLDHVERLLGKDARAMEITTGRLDTYAEDRLAEGAARSTINQELAALRRGFRLAVKRHLLAVLPVFELPKVHNERQGFFEAGDVAALELELPADLRPVIQFARYTGWRVHKEILPLTWDAVDWEGEVIRLAQADTKGGEARLYPFGLAPELKTLLEQRWKARDGLFVFHRNGKRIKDIRGAWEIACKRAGLLGRIPHDLRRTAARDMRRAGIAEGEIMKLCGWRTRSMFDRYNIIDEADLAAAVAKRFNGIEPAKKPPVEQPAA
jgi:integrase